MKPYLLTKQQPTDSRQVEAGVAEFASPTKTSLIVRILRYFTRLSISTFLWLNLLSAVLILWYLDRRNMERQLGLMNGVQSPAWSIDQVIGFPDTAVFGDISTAWASATQDASDEWMVIEFPLTVQAAGIDVYETHNPGAISGVFSVSMDGSERLLWEGKDPLKGSKLAGGTAKIRFAQNERTRRLKVVLDSARIAGWNEIDAIALIDANGGKQWVTRAWASSSYGKNNERPKWFWP